ncbi:MAG: hypothetical protein JWN85_1154 [Gammaproteobacteria bacterium]|nr:hypothetical protein [Gammaproteobacteria bacterium]
MSSQFVKHPRCLDSAFLQETIRSLDGEPIVVKVAIGFDDTLELLEGSTPLQFDFVAGHYTALIAAKDSDRRIGRRFGVISMATFTKTAGFSGGSKGKLTFHPWGPAYSSSGSRF